MKFYVSQMVAYRASAVGLATLQKPVICRRKVLSAQLSAGVTSTLRRVDDIAYLRWATVAKNFQSVREIADEAHDLVVRPSPRLVFDHREAPRTVPANSAL